MSTINYLTVRNTVLPVVNATRVNYSTLTGSTITATSLNLASTTISLGQSTNQTYNNFSNGSYLTWATPKSDMTTANKTVQSANGLYQMIVANATSGLFLSSDSGITWSTLTGGLPTLTGSAYWSDGAISANGQYITLSIYGGSLWMSADYGRTFALTNQPTPNIWLPLNGNTTDSMGLSVVTTPGTVPGYVTLNYPGYTAQAVNLANTAGGTATRYVRGTWAGAGNFTVSGWVNPQALTGVFQVIFSAYSGYCAVLINTSNQLTAVVPSGGGLNFVNVGASSTLVVNTWYYFSLSFQTNGTCSLYLNNTLIGSITNTQGVASLTTSIFGLSGYDGNQTFAFNGFMDDLKITNSVSAYVPIPLLQPNIWMPFENSAADLGSYSLPPSVVPTIYLPFEGNVTDSVGTSAPVATGAVSYPQANREGYTGQAIRLTNTSGGTALQYVRGTWSSPSIYTVSGWFNLQSYTTPNNQFIFSTGGTSGGSAVLVYVNASNILVAQIPNSVTISSGTVVLLNTWYYFTLKIFPSGSVCSLYLNNSVYTATATATGAASGAFGLGTFDSSSQANAFNGLIDDFRIYNADVPYVPVSNVNITGSLSYVPGVVGLNAVNLVNPAGGTAANYIRGVWTGSSNFTVSGWFNVQSFPASLESEIIGLGTSGGPVFQLVCLPAGTIYLSFLTTVWNGITSPVITLNTWYQFQITMASSGSGTVSFYLNNTLIGTGNGGTLNSAPMTLSLGAYPHSSAGAFNGYIDDLRIYNTAIPYHALFPQNYRSLALSGTGQYALASAASGWVVGSSNSSQTWSKQAVCVGTQNGFIQPNMSGLGRSFAALTTSPWTINGVTWIASSSSVFDTNNSVNYAFDNSSSSGEWVPLSNTYTTAGNSSGKITTIEGSIGNVTGEWLQIESSVPLIMSSYQFATGNVVARTPKTYYIVGSNNGSTWFPVQYGAAGAVTTTERFTTVPGIITVNSASTQIFGSSTITTTTYATTTNTYTYFRLICLSSYSGSNDVTSLGEWVVNFVRPLTLSRPPTHALSLNHTGQYQMVATGPAAGSIMPNLTGLAASTWTQGGVNWGVSTSSFATTGYEPYRIYNNSLAANGWDALGAYASDTGTYASSVTTSITSIGNISGEWVQLQSSVPLVLSSYSIASGSSAPQFPKTYFLIGSNDGSLWYPIQYSVINTNPFTTSFTSISSYITINTTGTQTIVGNQSGSVTTTAYSFSTSPYMFIRIVIPSIFPSNTFGKVSIGELYLNFSNSVSYSTNYGATWLNTSRTVSNETVVLSASGQYALSTNSVAPFARLRLDGNNVDAQGVLAAPTVVGTSYDTSTKVIGTHSAFFNNAAGPNIPSNYLNYTLPSVLNAPSMITMACWMYPTSIVVNITPMALCSGGGYGNHFFINPSGISFYWASTTTNGGTSLISTTTALVNTWTHICMTYTGTVLSLYVNGIIVASTNVTGRLCLAGGGNLTNMLIGSAITTANAFAGYVDDVRIYTSALNADEVNGLFKNPAITQTVAVSSSYLPITGYSEPTLPGITANVVDTAVSQTGQYMVAVTSSTTNNVYYSTDFGATFTALTVGSSAMVSCSISYDGSYLTVESATTVHTLNRNTRGFSVTVGNQAGLVNQAQNAIAIGDKAGRTNQSANSIVLNASGSALDAVAPGFYVSPVGTTTSSNATSFALLGYGTDNQVTQTNLTVLSNGNIGLGTTAPTSYFQVANGLTSEISGSLRTQYTSYGYTAATLASPNGANGSVSGPLNGVYTFTLNSGGQDALYNGLLPAGAFVQISITVRSPSSNVQLAIADAGYSTVYYTSPTLTNTLTTYTFTARISSSTQLFTRLLGGSNGSSWSWSDFSVQRMDTLMSGMTRIGTTTNSTDISTNSTSGTVQINTPVASFNSYNAGYPPNINTVVRNSIGAYYGVRDGVVSRGCAIDFEDVNTNGTYPTEIRGGQIRFYTCGVVGQGVNASPRMLIDTGGNLVMNITSAIYMYYFSNTNHAGLYTGAEGNIYIFTGTSGVSNRITVQNNGFVNIANLNTNGTVISTGGIGQLAVSSDLRIKENIVYQSDTQQGLTSILNLKPASYRLIGKSDTYLGFIAQDLEQEIPLAVDGKKYEWQWEEEDGKPKFDANGDIVYKLDADGNRIIRPRGVMDRAIIATQTLAIQELAKQATSQATLVKELSKQNTELTQKLDALSASHEALSASHAALIAWAQTQGFTL